MCLAVPLKITSIDGMDAVGEKDGVRRKIRIDLLKDPKVGEYVIVHAGFAIERLNEEQALLDLEAAREVEDALRELYS
ncbi:MAG: HypC/HybG/HupF family hydrogenase formation chaperone [Lachnospiraceae bacterium]|nr:HypC/HybG/HupF family hydrogenase formation chaperone [Lachnospiraceae bacterium]